MLEEAHHLVFEECMVGSSTVIKFLVSFIECFFSLLQIVQMFHHSDFHIRVNFESTS